WRMATETGWRPLQKPVRAVARAGGIGPTAFSKLAVAHLLSAGGDALVTLALAGSLFFDISPTAARGRVALSLILTMAPFGVVAPTRITPAREDRKPTKEETENRVGTPPIVMAAAVMAVLRFAVGFLTFLLAFDLRRGHAPAYWFGLILLASVGGSLVGAAI